MSALKTKQLYLRTHLLDNLPAEVNQALIADNPGKTLQIVRLEVKAGLPSKGYGQTVTVQYREYETMVKGAECPTISMSFVPG